MVIVIYVVDIINIVNVVKIVNVVNVINDVENITSNITWDYIRNMLLNFCMFTTLKLIADWPTNRPTDRQTDGHCHV